jgi:hypothetical protein
MAQPADIYDFIVRQGTPSKLPGPWKVFKCDPAFFNLDVAPETLLRRLRSEFESDDLNRAHVTKGNGKRATVLSPPLADNRSFIVAVRPKAEEKPRALLFAGMDKTLEGRWVLDAALADHHVQALLESLSRQLLIVSSAEDLAVLTSMGFPAAPAGGLDSLGGQRLELLLKRLGLQAPENQRAGREQAPGPQSASSKAPLEPIALILVNWSPSRLDLADVPLILQIRDRLRRLEELCGLEFPDFTIWKPTSKHLERLRFCIDNRTRPYIYSALLASLEQSCQTLELSALGPRPEPETLVEAVRELNAYPRTPSFDALTLRSWDRIERLLQKELIEPLLKQAEETADPLEKSLVVQLAGLTATLHTQLLRLATGAANSSGATGPRGPRGLPKEDLQQILALLDRVRTLAQDVQVCRKNNRFKLASLTRAKKTRPSSERSDLAPTRRPR